MGRLVTAEEAAAAFPPATEPWLEVAAAVGQLRTSSGPFEAGRAVTLYDLDDVERLLAHDAASMLQSNPLRGGSP